MEAWEAGCGTRKAQAARTREAFAYCRRVLVGAEGLEFYLASALLPTRKRPYTWALYGFARYTDEIVDTTRYAPERRTARFEAWNGAVEAALRSGDSSHPVLHALMRTLGRWDIPACHVREYLVSQEMDLRVTEYATYADLRGFIERASLSFGRQMLPVLEPLDRVLAGRGGDAMSEAMQLTNIVRDVQEDYRLGRVYLPQEDLSACGVSPRDLSGTRVTPQMRAVVRKQVGRARELLVTAELQEGALPPSSRPAVRAVHSIYGALLREVEMRDFDVFTSRVRLGPWRKAAIGSSALAERLSDRFACRRTAAVVATA
ncbi:phytoene/squalene synthase family protein [Streptomyces sp. NBC_00536]|uniref:phytoene/squalene synthase family protein n=1 Tax=Streptomyces sp. NBC_00536 TaxID=2975769 RepID=UPI002E8186CF|nr:phytoene/squalene synthase family protein [Streptomyces sp. NBC_00536]WUC83372.1 phytoene/squalene synthase family protein [Streptomyces sp. NBC_00536]